MDITGDFAADAHEGAVLRVSNLLRHPDDLANKLTTLRKKIAMERASVDAQLKTVMETQLDSTQKGINVLQKCKDETSAIKLSLKTMDHICGDTDNFIKNYEFIQKISRADQNFRSTKVLFERFQSVNSTIERVNKMLEDDMKQTLGPAKNMLLIHYHIQQLCIFRNKILNDAKGSSADVLEVLRDKMFKKVDQLEYKFEIYFWDLAKNTMDLVKSGHLSTVVRLIKLIEAEERIDESLLLQRLEKDLSVECVDMLRGRAIKGYRIKYFDLIRQKIVDDIRRIFEDQQKDLPLVLKAFDSIIDVLIVVNDDLAPLYPKRYNIFHFFVLEYHRGIYHMINTMTDSGVDAPHILVLLKWVRDYYSGMSSRLDVSEDLLEPKLLNGKEEHFMSIYVKLVRAKLTEWLKNILSSETLDFLERKMPPEMDTTGQYLLTGSVIAFQMFNQQLDVVASSSKDHLLSEIVNECCNVMEEFQNAWIKVVDLENNKYFAKAVDLNEGLVEFIIALANDCMRSTEFADTIINRLQLMSDERYRPQNISKVKNVLDGFMKIQKKCVHLLIDIVMSDLAPALTVLHCAQWYDQDVMRLIVGTFEDYADDFQKHMSEYLFNKLISELVDRFLISYIESFKNKQAKFKIPVAVDRMRSDLDLVVNFFARSKNAKRAKSSFEVIEKIIGLIESNPRMFYIDFYSLWKQFPDLPLDFVEKVLAKRDDLDKSTVREIVDLCRLKTKDERQDNFISTVFSKINKS